MAFLKLNGWTIPIAPGGASVANRNLGFRQQAFDGTMLTDRRAQKRSWDLQTINMSEIDALALEGMLKGEGDLFSYQDQTTYSAKGLPETGTTVSIFMPNRSQDTQTQAPITDENGRPYHPFQSDGVSITSARGLTRTNVVAANEADGSTYGAKSAGMTVTTDADAGALDEGCQSLNGSTSDWVETTAQTVTNGATYAGSVYLYGLSGTRGVDITLIDGGGTIGTASVTVPSGEWRRFLVTGTATTTSLKMRVAFTSGSSDVLMDNLMIERTSIDKPWIAGTSTRSDSDLQYDPALFAAGKDLTINFWGAASPSTLPTADAPFVYFEDRMKIYQPASTDGITFDTVGSDLDLTSGSVDSLADTTTWSDSAWVMVTCILRRNPETGENTKELWVNGALAASSNPSYVPETTTATSFQVAHVNGTNEHLTQTFSKAYLADLQILPYAAPSALISAWYNSGNGQPLPSTFPQMYLEGDVIPEDSNTVVVDSQLGGSAYSGRQDTTNNEWDTNRRAITFKLDES